jgi:hypothetical protein
VSDRLISAPAVVDALDDQTVLARERLDITVIDRELFLRVGQIGELTRQQRLGVGENFLLQLLSVRLLVAPPAVRLAFEGSSLMPLV